MKIFLTGASGMLAADIIPKLKSEGHDLVLTDAKPRLDDTLELDITDLDQVKRLIAEAKADYVFHLAAETNVDLCEQEPDHAFRVNTTGTENIALACQEQGLPMLYISTGGVFSGDKKDPYTELDEPGPVNVYGESKLKGENIVKDLLDRYFIIRAGWMVGGWEIDKKFVFKIVQQLVEGKTELTVVSDKFGSPTFTKDFANNLMNVVNSERYGVYHMANQGVCSRFDIAVKIVEFMGLGDKVEVKPVDSSQFPLPAPRANSEMMHNYNLDQAGLNHMPHWEDSLKDYIITNKDKLQSTESLN